MGGCIAAIAATKQQQPVSLKERGREKKNKNEVFLKKIRGKFVCSTGLVNFSVNLASKSTNLTCSRELRNNVLHVQCSAVHIARFLLPNLGKMYGLDIFTVIILKNSINKS